MTRPSTVRFIHKYDQAIGFGLSRQPSAVVKLKESHIKTEKQAEMCDCTS